MKSIHKKIGIDARFFREKSTGIGRHVYELIMELSKIDNVNTYIIFLNKKSYKHFSLPGKNFKKELTQAPHYSFNEQWKFLHQLNKHDFDLTIFPHFNAPVLYNKPFVVTIHDLTLHFFPGQKKTSFLSIAAYKIIINRISKKAKHCFAVSQNTKKDMIKHLHIPQEKITVTYNGISSHFQRITNNQIRTNFQKKYQLPKQFFLYTGVCKSHKNIARLIEAYKDFLTK